MTMIDIFLSIASGVVVALVTLLSTEFVRRPRLKIVVSDIQILPQFDEDDYQRTFEAARVWAHHVGDARIPISKELAELSETNPNVRRLKRIENCKNLVEFMGAVFFFMERTSKGQKSVENLIARIRRPSSLSKKEKLEIIDEIISDGFLDGHIVGGLRRGEFTLPPVPDKRRIDKYKLVDATEFSERDEEDGETTHGYRLRFPTFFSHIFYRGPDA